MNISEVLKERRTFLNLTQDHLAELAGVGLRTIKSIESGKGNPTLETVLKIADVLGLKVEFVIRNPVDNA